MCDGIYVPDSFFSIDISLNTSRRRNGDGLRQKAIIQSEAFEDDDIPDDDFLEAVHGLDSHYQNQDSVDRASNNSGKNERQTSELREDTEEAQSVMLENGKYNCNHKCKDKSTCKHFCCREGLDRPPKMHKNARHNERSKNNIQLPLFNNGIQKAPSKSSRRQWPSYDTIDYLDLTQPTQEEQHKQHIAPESKATRMANLDFASSQAILPKDTARKIARNTKRSNNRRRRSSSEYDDSGLDEFFSPMRPAVTDKTDVDSPTVGTSLDLNNHVDQIMGSSNSQPSNFVQSPFTSLVAKTLEPQGRLSYNAPNLSSFDPENTQIEASYYKSLASDQEGTLTKRKFESLT
ncbi:hypothetical protein F66182_18311, partial [Fusarium sp. NRRL 66182]